MIGQDRMKKKELI